MRPLAGTTLLLYGLIAAPTAAAECNGLMFHAPVRYAVSADEALLVADLDGDGAPEIITSGNSVTQRGSLSVLHNRGDGTFDGEILTGAGFGDRVEAAGDLNRDGIADVVCSNYWNNGIAIHPGLGNLELGPGAPYTTSIHGGPTRIFDYDGDGLADVVSLSFGSANPVRVHLFRGRADGALEPKVTHDVPSLAVAASPSVRMHDGAPEILAGDHSGHLAILRILPEGVAVTVLDAGPGMDLGSLFADVNGDGLADIVDANDGDPGSAGDALERLYVTLANGDGGFLERRQLAQPRRLTFPTELHAADFDGDGRLDLVAGDHLGAVLYFYRGDGAGNFDQGVAIDVAGPVSDATVADLNGDGRRDLVTANDDGTMSVILNRGRCLPVRRRAVRH